MIPPSARLLVVADQFEEVYTLCKLEEDRRALIDNLLEAAIIPDGPVILVLAIRADFLGKCAGYRRLADEISGRQKLIGKMEEDELHWAIEKPAVRAGGEIDPGLVELLLREVGSDPGTLPLLEFALTQLWAQKTGRRMTVADYWTIGGLNGALKQRADTILADLRKRGQEDICRRIFLDLIEPGECTEDTRRRIAYRQLAVSPQWSEVVETLVRERLVTTDNPNDLKEGSIEVVHEALIQNWTTLQDWVNADRKNMVIRTDLEAATNKWIKNSQHPDFLLDGLPLANAQDWAKTHPDDLSRLSQVAQFLVESQKAEDKSKANEIAAARRLAEEAEARRRAEEERAVEAERREQVARAMAAEERKRRWATVALVVSILVMATLVGGGWAWFQRREWDRTLRSKLAVEQALGEAERLGDAARTTPDLTHWAEAVRTAEGTQHLLDSGGGDEALRRRVAGLLKEYRKQAETLRDRERDQQMIAKLDEARLLGAGTKEGGIGYDRKAAIPEYRRAFREYGIDVGVLPPQDAAERIRAKPRGVREALAAALDNWAWQAEPPDKARLQVIARAADADPRRNAIRDAVARGDVQRLRQLARDLDLAHQPTATLLRLGEALRQAGEFDEVVALLQQAQRLHPGDFWISQDLASAYRSLNPPQYDQAIRYFTAAVALRPKSPGVHNNLGIVWDEKGDYDAAIVEYREALRLRPDLSVAHINLGNTLWHKGDRDAAIAEYRKALRLKPDDFHAHYNLALALRDKGDYDAAIAECREALRLKPDDPVGARNTFFAAMAHNSLGLTLRNKGNHDAAIAEYREALWLKPDLSLPHYNLALALRDKGDQDGAIAEYREALRLKPDGPDPEAHYDLWEVHGNLGVALEVKGDHDAAIAEYREALWLRPDDPVTHYNLGAALATKGDRDGEIAEYREALRLRPDFFEAHTNLGAALEVKGDHDAAIAEYRAALRLKPDSPEAHTNLGAALVAKGDHDAAPRRPATPWWLKPGLTLVGSPGNVLPYPFSGKPHTNLGFPGDVLPYPAGKPHLVLPKGKGAVTPKVNKVGRPIAKAGPVTRRNAALRANKEVIDRTRELKKVADKAGLGPGMSGSKISMDRPLKQTKEVSVTLCSYAPKAELSRDVDGEPLGAQDAIFGDLKQKGYLTDADKQDFDTKYGKGDWAGIEKLLATKNVPPDLRNVYMKQIELAQRFNQYKDAAMTGAEGGQLAYLKGQFDAAAKDYNDAVQKAANLGLLKPEDFAERLLAIDDISRRMDTINQYAKVRDLCTQPFSPDPSGRLTLSGGPVMIFTDPDPSLPGGMMTQLSTDLVAIGTGGQGDPLVQVGSPSDVGYPLITSVRPVPEASTAAVERTSDQALVINPATTRATVNFEVDQTPYRLEAGLAQPLIGQTSWVIAFDRGGQAGEARYTLAPGGYSFTVKANGWDLVQKTFKVTLDNSLNPEDFNYVLDNQAGVVTARQEQEITSKLPIVLAFDRGDGREVAHKELAEGTYAIGIDPQTRLLDLFPGPAAANAPLSSITNLGFPGDVLPHPVRGPKPHINLGFPGDVLPHPMRPVTPRRRLPRPH